MFSVFLLFFGVPMTPEVEKNTPWGPGAALANPPLGGLIEAEGWGRVRLFFFPLNIWLIAH